MGTFQEVWEAFQYQDAEADADDNDIVQWDRHDANLELLDVDEEPNAAVVHINDDIVGLHTIEDEQSSNEDTIRFNSTSNDSDKEHETGVSDSTHDEISDG